MTDQIESPQSASLSQGYWFMFQHEGVDVAAYGSGLSGKEVVYVNDDPVSSKRSLGFVSRHQFEHQGKQYQVTYEMENVFTGKVSCTLQVDGQCSTRQRQEKALFTSVKSTLLGYIGFALVGGIVGFVVAMLAFELLL